MGEGEGERQSGGCIRKQGGKGFKEGVASENTCFYNMMKNSAGQQERLNWALRIFFKSACMWLTAQGKRNKEGVAGSSTI